MVIHSQSNRFQPEQSFACAHYRDTRFRCPFHNHQEYELTLILSGSGYRITGNHFGHFEKGDLVLHGSNLPHFYQSWANDPSPAHSISIQFDAEQLPFFHLPECKSISRMLDISNRGLLFQWDRSDHTRSMMESIMVSTGATRISLLLNILDELSKLQVPQELATSDYQNRLNPQRTQRIERVLQYIHKNFAFKVDLDDTAHIADLHPQSFSRFFRQHLGMPFQNYLVKLRLSHATREILQESKSITEIANDAGFSNLSNFNRLFKRQFGDTPSAYLKEIKRLELKNRGSMERRNKEWAP